MQEADQLNSQGNQAHKVSSKEPTSLRTLSLKYQLPLHSKTFKDLSIKRTEAFQWTFQEKM